jgi:serine/threonine protein kinase
MGEVRRAHDTVTGPLVAIKVLSANLSQDVEFRRRFRRRSPLHVW